MQLKNTPVVYSEILGNRLFSNDLDTLKKLVGIHIRELRKKHGFRTVEAFAEALQVHPNSVGELERGANWLSPEMLEKMVCLLKKPPSYFYPGEDSELMTLIGDLDQSEQDGLLIFLKGIKKNKVGLKPKQKLD